MIYKIFDVVVVPFPFTDRNTDKKRPALVLSDHDSFNSQTGNCVLAMITSAKNPDWPLDVKNSIPLISSKSIYIKLLSTFDWYTLLSLLPKETLRKALSDDVLNDLFPKTRKDKYRYARQILFP